MRYPVLLHGFTGSSASWGDRIVDGLGSTGAAPVLVDLPGHGRHRADRDPARFTLAAAMTVVREAGVWPTDLVGYSMGGRLALHMVAAHPGLVDRLVLESASPGLATEDQRAERRRSDAELARTIEATGVPAFVDRWEALPMFGSQGTLPADVRALHRELRLANEPGGLAGALTGLGTGSLPSLWDRLPEIETPTLLLAGALDTKFVAIAERIAALLPNADIEVVPGAGHAVHVERPGAWLDAVTSFLD